MPYDRATVMVAIDTSGSMAATDVPPNRLEAAKAAAVAFVDELPDTVNVGVVSFAGSSAVVAAPSTDHAQVQQQISTLQLAGGGTAIGESVFASLDQIEAVAADADGEPVPSRVVVLSDGGNTAGRSPDRRPRPPPRPRRAGLHHRVRDRRRRDAQPGGGTPVPVDGETLRPARRRTPAAPPTPPRAARSSATSTPTSAPPSAGAPSSAR